MAVPEVYAGFGSYSTNISELADESTFTDANILTGPNWFYTLTGNGQNKYGTGLGRYDANTNWYCLDLLSKYHKKSPLKQFHALTFYFRNSQDNTKGAIITSMLPETFSYSIGGIYTNPVSLGGSELVNAVMQEFTNGSSLSFNVDTSIIWQSPKRMEITFKIPIFDDSGSGTNINYQEAIQLFGEAILPEVGTTGLYDRTPGPNILTALKYRATEAESTVAINSINNAVKKTRELTEAAISAGKKVFTGDPNAQFELKKKWWDRICVQVGGLLLLDWCVIKDMRVTFPNTKAQVLHDYRSRDKTTKVASNISLEGGGKYAYKVHLQPIQAEIEVTISTIMGMTRATFKDMLYQNTSVEDYEETNDTSAQKKQESIKSALEMQRESNKANGRLEIYNIYGAATGESPMVNPLL